MLGLRKEIHFHIFSLHQHHSFWDKTTLCGSHSVYSYSVTMTANDHRKVMSPQLSGSNNKKAPFRMGRSEVRLNPRGKSDFQEPQIKHTDCVAVLGTFL